MYLVSFWNLKQVYKCSNKILIPPYIRTRPANVVFVVVVVVVVVVVFNVVIDVDILIDH